MSLGNGLIDLGWQADKLKCFPSFYVLVFFSSSSFRSSLVGILLKVCMGGMPCPGKITFEFDFKNCPFLSNFLVLVQLCGLC